MLQLAHPPSLLTTLAPHMHRLVAMVLATAVALVVPGLAAGRSRRLAGTPVPRGFVGMNVDGPMMTPQGGVAMPDQFALMRSSGVRSVRALFSWSDAQPYSSSAQIPAAQRGAFVTGAGGIPTTFASTDQIVSAAAYRGMTVLPIVMYTPSWAAVPRTGTGLQLPRDNRLYARYLTTLIGRYGPRGSFWGQHPGVPRRPIRMWEVWDEPDLAYFWPTRPWQASYVALLGPARAAIKRADPRASVVLAGLTAYSWLDLASVYQVRGARSLFDVVEVHPYTKYPRGVIQILRFVRSTMDRAGDRGKPMIAGETGWMSSLHQTAHMFDYETNEAGQAQRLAVLLRQLAVNRTRLNLIGFDWYTWMGYEYAGASPFNFSGLLADQNGKVRAKPALAAFSKTAHAIER
jgi:hypothetical protein